MKVRLVREDDLRQHGEKLPDLPTVYFKMVSVGAKTLAENEHDPGKVCDKVGEQSGFYLIGETFQEVIDAMHDLTERFYDAHDKGKQDESESKTQE